MPAGIILLLIVGVLVYFGFAQRILDRMRLSDTQALMFLGLMFIGTFIDIPILQGRTEISLNVGGALVPLALAAYLLTKADSTKEWVRALVAAGITAGVVYGVSQLTDFEPPRRDIIDPVWLFGIIAGIVGYLTAGRSRRAAFVAGTLGILLTDVIHLIRAFAVNLPTTVAIGGAGVFDTIILAGIIAVGLAELVGETRERIQGGPEIDHGGQALKNKEFMENQTNDEEIAQENVGEVDKLTAEHTGPADEQLNEAEREKYLQGIHGKEGEGGEDK